MMRRSAAACAMAITFACACGRRAATLDLTPAASASVSPKSAPAEPSCGPLECRLFDSPEDAVRAATAGHPLVIAFGEAHAPKGTEGIPSAARRFIDTILPVFKDDASDLLLELMLPPSGCTKKVAAAREAEAPATETHAASDQGEYVAIGNAARPIGIVPDLLRPSCDDLAQIADAGDDAIAATLSATRRLTVAQTKALLARHDRPEGAPILLYGGALHDDPEPSPETADWSYGPELAQATGGRYVAIDLFVPEYVTDSPAWRAWSFYPYYDRARFPGKTWMFHPKPKLYVVLFAPTPR